MASLSTLTHRQGFTIIELITTISITSLVLSFGAFFSLDFYRNYALISERDVVLDALRKARSQSIHNIHQTSHAVLFEANPSLAYTIIECSINDPSCSEAAAGQEASTPFFSRMSLVAPSPLLPFRVVFAQLSGDCSNCHDEIIVRIGNEKRYYDITITQDGKING